MHRHYFEELHRAEARHAEWHMLDQALADRRQAPKLRVMLGHWIMQAGARIAGKSHTTLLPSSTECCNCSPGGC